MSQEVLKKWLGRLGDRYFNSIRSRVTATTLLIFIFSILAMGYYNSVKLHDDIEKVISAQQVSSATILAGTINAELENRIKALEATAKMITPEMIKNQTVAQKNIVKFQALALMFNQGIFIAGTDGISLANTQEDKKLFGVNYSYREWFKNVLKGKTIIGDPVTGTVVKMPLFVIATPIRDRDKIIGILWGGITLGRPNFISEIVRHSHGKKGGYIIVSRKIRKIVFATDKKRIMESLVGTNISPQIEKYMKGEEGFGVIKNPLGIEVLSAAKNIPLADWYGVVTTPAEEVFAPSNAYKSRMFWLTLIMMLLAGYLIQLALKRQLSPIFETIKKLSKLSTTNDKIDFSHINSRDEIGQLISSFINLLNKMQDKEILLQESEERYRLMYTESQEAITLTNPETGFIGGNPAAIKLYACRDEEDFISRTPASMSPEYQTDGALSAEKAQEMMRLALEKGSHFFEWTHRKADGTDFPATVLLWRVGKSGTRVLQATVRDITEHKRAEKAILESEAKYRTLVETTGTGFLILDSQGRVLDANQEYVRLTGYNELSEILGRSVIEWTAEYARQRNAEAVAQCARDGQIRNFVIDYVDSHGKITPVEINATVSVEGESPRLICLCRDIRERKQSEEEKARLQEQLIQSHKMESIGRLAGGVAHDFNNMLGVIIGHAEIAMDKADNNQSLLTDLQEIQNAAERSSNLTRQLLAFARRQTISPKVLNLNETVAGMLNMLQRLIGEDIHQVWSPGVNLWPIKIDPSQVDQILANLFVNARDAIPGNGKITIETGNISIDETFCADHTGFLPGEYVIVAVSDDGCGMDKGTLDNLFEPFFTTKALGKGTGLGLAMVYGIVKQNNGFINVYSEPDHGTTFRIYLPRHVGEDEQPLAEIPQEPIMHGQETILLVEDEVTLLDLNTLLLQAQGYRVLPASSPSQAIHLAEEHAGEIHLLMTDVVMPEMNGRDLAKKLLSQHPHLKCLFTSGYTANVIAHNGVLDDGVYFIQKPFSRRDLAAKVREVLDQT